MKQNPTVAYQGEPGAYSEAAALEHFGTDIETLPSTSFEQAFEYVQSGQADYGMLPIENSLAGSIHRNYDLMVRHDLQVCGEYHFRVSHCLLALPEAKLEDVQRAHSHPQALAQCEASLNELGLERLVEADTAGSARLVKEWNDKQAAAIASSRAAEVYGLQILREKLEDQSNNYTRFLVLSADEKVKAGEGVEYKSSIVFSLQNIPGALFKALSVFALRDIDLTKIESRPIPEKTWEYLFYVDFIGHAEDLRIKVALDNLSEYAQTFRLLGSYPRHLVSA
ncbi:MAG: prephenate dehydratase [Chloroflexi bacterium]|nr:MAG: prephenate dehydratase [Chloroflexota bacterium]MBL1193450.1 prephenate dehydratase [Chloroflexota bacterium]NOH10741.1 prephenate dehydratase [Chloroflexota bacterium]